jgi:hypothetical protein
MRARISKEEAFRRHLLEHPQVRKILVRLARQEKANGVTKCSIRLLWETARRTNPKLLGFNDHHHSHYSRWIMANHPDLDGMFYTRRLRAA